MSLTSLVGRGRGIVARPPGSALSSGNVRLAGTPGWIDQGRHGADRPGSSPFTGEGSMEGCDRPTINLLGDIYPVMNFPTYEFSHIFSHI